MRRITFFLGLTVALSAWAYKASAETTPTNLSLTARSLGVDGRPCRACKTFWRAVGSGAGDASAASHPEDASDDPKLWRDSRTGKVWRPIHSWGAGESATVDKLLPGHYRVSAALGQGVTPFGVSEVIHLDGSQKQQTASVRLLAGPSLTVTARDVRTMAPLDWFLVRLEREDGFRVAQGVWSRDSRVKFDQLPPGSYRLTASRTSSQYGWPEYAAVNGPIEVRIEAGKDEDVSVPLAEVKLSEEVVRQRWPFVVQGRVTDQHGQPLDGVMVNASCGIGSLLPTGQALSGTDGRYTLRFSGGYGNREGDEWHGPVQYAAISANKSGFAEQRRSCQGVLLVAERMPDPGELTHYHSDRTKVVLPQQSFALDFIMIPAATLKGQLLDAQGRPMARERVYLCGKELPPGASVFGQVHTDAGGRFRFADVPPRRAWWFSLPDKANVRSGTVTVDQPVQSVNLRFASQDGEPVLELADRDDGRGTVVSLGDLGTNAAAGSELAGAIVGTTWQWDAPNERITFGKDGLIHHPGWEQRGLVTSWQVIDEHTVLLTIEKGRRVDRYAVLVFNADFTKYAGYNFHGAEKITPCKQVRD